VLRSPVEPATRRGHSHILFFLNDSESIGIDDANNPNCADNNGSNIQYRIFRTTMGIEASSIMALASTGISPLLILSTMVNA